MFIKLLFNVKGPFPQQGNMPPKFWISIMLSTYILGCWYLTHANVGIWLMLMLVFGSCLCIWLMLLYLAHAKSAWPKFPSIYYIPTWISVMRIWHMQIFLSLKKRMSQGPLKKPISYAAKIIKRKLKLYFISNFVVK